MSHSDSSAHPPAGAPAKPVNLRPAFYVFGTQLLITAMIVTAYYLPWGQTTWNMLFTIVLSLCQAALVLCFSMHFITEKKFIYGVALFTGIFLSAMLYLILTAGSASGHLHVNHVS